MTARHQRWAWATAARAIGLGVRLLVVRDVGPTRRRLKALLEEVAHGPVATVPASPEVLSAAGGDLHRARRLVTVALFAAPWIPGLAALGLGLELPGVWIAALAIAPAVVVAVCWSLAWRLERRAS